jgi:hypothetical protein
MIRIGSALVGVVGPTRATLLEQVVFQESVARIPGGTCEQDGPLCILSIVDNRTFKRLAYQVLSHDPPIATWRRSSAGSTTPGRLAG